MGRIRKRVAHARRARISPYTIKDARRYVFSTLACGFGCDKSREFMLLNNIIPPSRTSFYKIQKEMIDLVEEEARACCERAKKESPDNDTLLHDGAWCNKRNGMHMMLTYMSAKTDKIVDYRIVSKNSEQSDISFDGASKLMEETAQESLGPQWTPKPNIIARVHDQDTTSFKAFVPDENCFELPSFLDPGHSRKSFDRYIDSYSSKRSLEGFKAVLKLRFRYVINQKNKNIDQKRDIWLRTSDELIKSEKYKNSALFKGIPSKNIAPHEFRKNIDDFLEKTIYFIESCSGGSTNPVESWNAYRAKVTSKNYVFPVSWRLRTSLAIIKWNEPENFLAILQKILMLTPLSDECQTELRQIEAARTKARIKSKTLTEIKKKAKRRSEKRKNNKSTTKGHTEASNSKENKERDVGDKYFHRSTVLYPGIIDKTKSMCLAACLQTVIRTMAFPQSDEDSPIIEIMNIICNILHRQANEDCVSDKIVQSVRDIIESRKPKTYCDTNNDEAYKTLSDLIYAFFNNRYIRNNFGFVVTITKKCECCKYTNITVERVPVLTLPITDDIYDSITRVQGEKIEDDEYCPNCRAIRKFELTRQISFRKFVFFAFEHQKERAVINCSDFVVRNAIGYSGIFRLLSTIHKSNNGTYCNTIFMGEGVTSHAGGARVFRALDGEILDQNVAIVSYQKDFFTNTYIKSPLLHKCDFLSSHERYDSDERQTRQADKKKQNKGFTASTFKEEVDFMKDRMSGYFDPEQVEIFMNTNQKTDIPESKINHRWSYWQYPTPKGK